jgi:PhnB protein
MSDLLPPRRNIMSKRPAKPANMSWLSPYLCVKDCDKASDFYQKAFGFEVKFAMKMPDGRTGHTEMTFKDASIMFGPEHAWGQHGTVQAPVTSGIASPVQLYVYCDDVNALFDRAKAAGAQVVAAPSDMFYGDRVCKLKDPDGHDWCFATNTADFDPAKAPGC